MNYYLAALKRYADFSGRSRRSEYWLFVLFNIIISVILGVVDVALGMDFAGGFGVLYLMYSLAVLIPGIAVCIRRLHDTGRSGWWLLIALVPFVGSIVLLVFLVQDSENGANKWGPNPKAGFSPVV